jgi:hypothetical protein
MKKQIAILSFAFAASLFLLSCKSGKEKETPQSEAASPIPYRVELVECFNKQLPNLHSYTYGIYNDQVILFGGRTRGLHSSGYNFKADNQNNFITVINTNNWSSPENWIITSQPISKIITTDAKTNTTTTFFNAYQFNANNAEFFTKGNTLYVIGGLLGATPATENASLPYTLPLFTAIDMPSLINAVNAGTTTAQGSIRQDSVANFAITGGELGVMSDTVYLAFGWNYGPSNQFNGAYTHQVSSFTYTDSGINSALKSQFIDNCLCRDNSPVPNPQSLGNFRRRDGSMCSYIDPSTGNKGFMYFAGVFKNGDTNFDTPVWINSSSATEQTAFTMRSNVYTCKVLPAYSASLKESYATMMGGITNSGFTYPINSGNLLPVLMTQSNAATFTPDVNTFSTVPFSNNITTIKWDANKSLSQYGLPSAFPALSTTVQIPSAPIPATLTAKILQRGTTVLNGAESEMFINLNSKYLMHNEVINYDALIADSTKGAYVGYLFGGILSDTTNTNMNSSPAAQSQLLNTIASNRLFKIRIVPYSSGTASGNKK